MGSYFHICIYQIFLIQSHPYHLVHMDNWNYSPFNGYVQVFWKARMRCREDLNEQLADFRNKRSAGLGSIFGPADHLLEESKYNKAKELQIVEHLLVPCLESVS